MFNRGPVRRAHSFSVTTTLLLFLCGNVWCQEPTAPAQLRPPDGAQLLMHAGAKGDQIYSCKKDDSGYQWILKAPDAQLFDESGKLIGSHFAGPSWQLADNSKVIGKVLARSDSSEANAIPWLLLTVTEHSGDGMMAEVTHVQRLNTKGGKAPTTGCDSSHGGEEVRVPYKADYFFYSAKSPR
jgi:hypothetical protein